MIADDAPPVVADAAYLEQVQRPRGGITLDLASGSYLLIRPIPADETAPPHVVLGMITSLTVT
jgi:hypothetical protein